MLKNALQAKASRIATLQPCSLKVFGVYADRKLIPLTNWAVDLIEESFPRQVVLSCGGFQLVILDDCWTNVQYFGEVRAGRNDLTCCPSQPCVVAGGRRAADAGGSPGALPLLRVEEALQS